MHRPPARNSQPLGSGRTWHARACLPAQYAARLCIPTPQCERRPHLAFLARPGSAPRRLSDPAGAMAVRSDNCAQTRGNGGVGRQSRRHTAPEQPTRGARPSVSRRGSSRQARLPALRVRRWILIVETELRLAAGAGFGDTRRKTGWGCRGEYARECGVASPRRTDKHAVIACAEPGSSGQLARTDQVIPSATLPSEEAPCSFGILTMSLNARQ